MRKWAIYSLIAGLVMSLSVTAYAASPSFSDVPKDHWAYGAVGKIAESGLIDGYSDGTFRGKQAVSRYEFAIVITKALEHYDKADAANKALLDKLSAEFAAELNTLGTRVTKVEKKLGTFKINGNMRLRHEYVKNPSEAMSWPGGVQARNGDGKVHFRDRYRLMLSNEIDPNLSVFTLITFSGTNSGSLRPNYSGDGGTSINPSMTGNVEAMFATYKAPDGSVYKFGRNFLFLGQGLLWDVPHADGVQVTFGNKLRTMIGTQSFITKDWYFADMKYDVNPNLQLTAAHLADEDKQWYNSTALGFVYKGIPDWKISGEYGINDRAKVNVNNARSGEIKAGNITVKHREANREQVGTFGAWVTYKKAQKGFDTQYGSAWTFVSNYPGGLADDLKGFEYGIEYTPFKNSVLQVLYNPLKSYDGTRDREFLISQLIVNF
jgi:hypothetical protein